LLEVSPEFIQLLKQVFNSFATYSVENGRAWVRPICTRQ